MAKVKTNFKPPKARHFIREWRKHRGFTLEELGEMVGVTDGALSQLERGLTNYTQPTLEALAVALSCEPRDLIGRPPNTDWGIAHLLRDATDVQRKQLYDMAVVLLRTGTDR